MLLILKVSVNGEENFEPFRNGATQKRTVLDPGPAEPWHCVDIVLAQSAAETRRKALIQQYAHPATQVAAVPSSASLASSNAATA